jgi:hypothetical protein
MDVGGHKFLGRGEPFEDEHNGSPSRADVDRLVTGVQDQNGLM